MKKKKPNSQLCAICGKRSATTVDHIPPKSIFPKPRPNNLITVPACFSCNWGASRLDESFMVYLSLHVGMDNIETERLWKNHALRAVKHNRRLRNRLLTTMKPVYLKSPGGIITEQRMGSPWDSEAHDKIIERMIRGLYFYHFSDILGDRVKYNVQWLPRIPDEIHEMSKEWQQHVIGSGQIVYRYGRAQEDPLHSVWLFQFYDRHWASGYTEPMDQPNNSLQLANFVGS